ncbi:Possible 4-carboxymuconolactone decarboxylase [Mycobacteroides abscessus subsp. abscessus]|nr:Possible 4-carboxymuconolactone decarboxylase [Mycobacteroides abscessus subsp. abscessus]
MRDRRLLLLGAVSALGLDEILEIQTSAALKNGELTEAELREVAIFITHYVGWPLGQRVNKHVEMAVAKQNEARRTKESSDD